MRIRDLFDPEPGIRDGKTRIRDGKTRIRDGKNSIRDSIHYLDISAEVIIWEYAGSGSSIEFDNMSFKKHFLPTVCLVLIFNRFTIVNGHIEIFL